MAFLDLIGTIVKKEVPKDESFLSLALTPEKVLASIWTFDGKSVQVLGFSKKSFSNVQSTVHQAAVAIDSAAEKAKSDVSKTVFGLSQNWFEKKEPTKETAKLLKKLSEELDLSAQAFVPISAAIKNFLKVKESVTPHSVLLGVFDEFLEVHLVLDNEVRQTITANTKPTVAKIGGVLKELKENQDLPARIVVFGISNDSKIAEGISKAEFKDIFHNLPKIEFLKDSEIAKSVAFAQAADILGHELPLIHSTVATDAAVKDHTRIKPEANELGFIEGEDILKFQQEETTLGEKPEEKQELAVEDQPARHGVKNVELTAVDESPPQPKGGFAEQIATLGWFAKIQNIFKGPGFSKKLAIVTAVILIVGFAGLSVGGRTQTSAEVVIKVNAKSSEDTFGVDVVKGSSNFTKDQITGQEISATASDSRKAVATGTKELGEPAKGEIMVLNWTTSENTFSQGTVIISKNGIKFELDSDVEVASRSGMPAGPGKTKVSVTAIDFGSEGNLGGGNDFTFQEYDELLYSATNDAAFTGGDEKEVTIVSQDDLDKLRKSLQESLENAALASLKEKATGKNVLEDAIEIEIVKQIFDKDLEEEATLVNLDLEVKASVLAYEQEELKKYLAQNSSEDAPENLEAKPNNIEILSLDTQSFNNTLNLTGKFKVDFIPKFDENDLKEKIAGKSIKETRQIIKEIPEVSDVEVNFRPAFFISSTLPGNKDKISFKVES